MIQDQGPFIIQNITKFESPVTWPIVNISIEIIQNFLSYVAPNQADEIQPSQKLLGWGN